MPDTFTSKVADAYALIEQAELFDLDAAGKLRHNNTQQEALRSALRLITAVKDALNRATYSIPTPTGHHLAELGAHRTAGQALAEWALGYRVRKARIQTIGYGHMSSWWPRRSHTEREIVRMAGGLAQVRRSGGDLHRALNPVPLHNLYRSFCAERAGRILDEYATGHAALVDALLARGRLPGREVHRILDRGGEDRG